MKDLFEGIGYFVFMIMFFSFIAGIVFAIAHPLRQKQCYSTWSDFEHSYDWFEGCRIKVGGKWIPADSYYFKEE